MVKREQGRVIITFRVLSVKIGPLLTVHFQSQSARDTIAVLKVPKRIIQLLVVQRGQHLMVRKEDKVEDEIFAASVVWMKENLPYEFICVACVEPFSIASLHQKVQVNIHFGF